jgi:hypothetical protein
MPILAITNGRRFTDLAGYVWTIPELEEDLYSPPILSDEPDFICDHCDAEDEINVYAYPVVLQDKESGERMYSYMHFRQCPTCSRRADLIMATSDHLALGEDEWDLLDSACEITLDPRWDLHKPWTMEASSKQAKTLMPVTTKGGTTCFDDKLSLSAIVSDLIPIISQHLVTSLYHSKRQESAAKIQALWKGWKQRTLGHKCSVCSHPLRSSSPPTCTDSCQTVCRSCGGQSAYSLYPTPCPPPNCLWCSKAFQN